MEHPIFYGYTEKTVPIKYTNGPLLQVPRDDESVAGVVAQAANDTNARLLFPA